MQVSPPGKAADKVTQAVHFIAKPENPNADRAAGRAYARSWRWCSRAPSTAPTSWHATLVADGFNAAAIHGNKSQGQRDRAIEAFRDRADQILVATDVAARGIDIPDVKHVYNYDLPEVPDNYVHRIGRTARAGQAMAPPSPSARPTRWAS